MLTPLNPLTLTVTEGKPIALSTESRGHSALASEKTKLPFKAKESFKVICGCNVIFPSIEQKKKSIPLDYYQSCV